MEVKAFEFNPIAENTYVLYDDTRECVIIDAGCFYPDEKVELLNFILNNDLVVKHLLNTHLHFDHILGNAFVKEQFDVYPEGNKADNFLLRTMNIQLKMYGFPRQGRTPRIQTFLKENDVVEFGNQRFVVLEVPGHSPGSIAFYSEENECVFSGDALFRGTIGRTDIARGDHGQLIESIRTKLFTLPLETVVYPGHGPATTIKQEMMHNFFASELLASKA